jgi:hypothetical protein
MGSMHGDHHVGVNGTAVLRTREGDLRNGRAPRCAVTPLRVFAVFDQRSAQLLDHLRSPDDCDSMRSSLAASVSNLESTAYNGNRDISQKAYLQPPRSCDPGSRLPEARSRSAGDPHGGLDCPPLRHDVTMTSFVSVTPEALHGG